MVPFLDHSVNRGPTELYIPYIVPCYCIEYEMEYFSACNVSYTLLLTWINFNPSMDK